ncbi:MAG: HNH endonuclease [Actinomycetota bacterium]|nr:HNH endonuclease [Actinomycetota bacterium]MDQ5807656.1 HNH endonuclease [Actinomycetota bacterium]
MKRTPPVAVRKALRAEVGFRCPVSGRGSPYLTWHHFDPPWRDREHHDPAGMVALCIEHHAQADAGAFTDAQLRELKRAGDRPGSGFGAAFNWMREDLIAIVGGIFFVDVAVAVQLGRHPTVWFNRDDLGHLLVNLELPSLTGEPRLRMEDNFWIETGEPEDLECPPSGTSIRAKYANGDRLSVRFREIVSKADFVRCYPHDSLLDDALAEAGSDMSLTDIALEVAVRFPIAVVEIELKLGGTPIDLRARKTMVQGRNRAGTWIMDSPLGHVVQVPDDHPWAGQSELQKQLYGDRGT